MSVTDHTSRTIGVTGHETWRDRITCAALAVAWEGTAVTLTRAVEDADQAAPYEWVALWPGTATTDAVEVREHSARCRTPRQATNAARRASAAVTAQPGVVTEMYGAGGCVVALIGVTVTAASRGPIEHATGVAVILGGLALIGRYVQVAARRRRAARLRRHAQTALHRIPTVQDPQRPQDAA